MTKRKKLNIIVLVLVPLFIIFLGAMCKEERRERSPGFTVCNRPNMQSAAHTRLAYKI